MSDSEIIASNEWFSVRKRFDGISIRLTVKCAKDLLEQPGCMWVNMPDGSAIYVSVEYDDLDKYKGENVSIGSKI